MQFTYARGSAARRVARATRVRSPRTNFLMVGVGVLSVASLTLLTSTAEAATKTTKKAAPKATRRAQAPVTVAPLQPGAITVPTAEATTGVAIGSKISIYQAPAATGPAKVLTSGKEIKGRVVFDVLEQRSDWTKVKVPARPNGAVGWVRTSDISTYNNAYYMIIEIGARRLSIFNKGQFMFSAPVAVGKSAAPTPTGKFFTVDLIRVKQGPNGPYGPYAYGISAFSNVHFTYGAGGDGRVGIHGTNRPDLLGQAVTDGCIRVSNENILRMRAILPLGVPVEIRQ